MPDYDESQIQQYGSKDDGGGTLMKAAGALALTFAGWAVYQGAATWALKGLSTGFVSKLKDMPSVTGGLKVMRDVSVKHGLDDMWSVLNHSDTLKGGGKTASVAKFVQRWEGAGEKARNFYTKYEGSSAGNLSKLRAIRGMDSGERGALLHSMGAEYLKTFAYEAPMFYLGEKALGIMHRDSRERQKKDQHAWYNLPAHAWDFAKWAPTFMAFDVVGRAAMAGAPIAKDYLRKKATNKMAGTQGGELITKALEQANSFMTKMNAKVHQIGGAYETAFRETGGHSGQGILFKRDSSKATGYAINHDPMGTLYKRARIFRNQYGVNKKKITKAHFTRSMAHWDNLTDSSGNIDDAPFSLALDSVRKEGKSTFSDTMMDYLWRTNTRTGKLGMLPRLLGLRESKMRHVQKHDQNLFDTIYKDNVELTKKYRDKYGSTEQADDAIRYIWGLTRKQSITEESMKKAFMNMKYKKGVYFDPSKGKMVNLNEASPGSVMRNALYYATRSVSFGRKFDTPALFQLNLLRSKSPNFVASSDEQILDPNAILPAMRDKIHGGLMRFGAFKKNPSPDARQGLGIYIKRPVDKGATMFSMVDGVYTPISTPTLSLLPGYAHSKLRNVLLQKYGLLNDPSAAGVETETVANFGQGIGGKTRKWLYDKVNLFGGDGLNKSAYAHVKSYFGSSGLKNLYNKSKNALLREKGFDIKNYSGEDDIAKLGSYLEHVNASLNKVTGMSDVMLRHEVFSEILKPGKTVLKNGVKTNEGELELLRSINQIGVDKILSDPTKAMDAVELILKQGQHLDSTVGVGEVQQLYKHLKNSDNIHDYYNAIGTPIGDKFRGFIVNYRMNSIFQQGAKDELNIMSKQANTLASRIMNTIDNTISSTTNQRDRAIAQMTLMGGQFRGVTRNRRFTDIAYDVKVTGKVDEYDALLDVLKKADDDGVLENFSKEIGRFVKYREPDRFQDEMFKTSSRIASREPYLVVNKDLKSTLGLSGAYLYDTFGQTLDFMGLGWNRAKYKDFLPRKLDDGSYSDNVVGLWAKRALFYAGAVAGYRAVDTFLDINPMFDGTMLDEGLTVAAADVAANTRLAAAKIFDIAGVTDAAKYVEGLMPKSTSAIPGAVLGFAMGGIPGMLAGGVLNRYTKEQLAGGPLSSLALLPPIAPFVADLTKSYDELKDIYSGKQMVPYRKGAGWSTGTTPIEGGKVQAWVPSWYTRLKSQYKATPALYGSKLEEFIFKDLPLIDFSFGDLINPQYLTRKQAQNRPYVVPDVPFSEVPIIGPVLGATVGRLYNAIHPFGSNAPMHAEEAMSAMSGGVQDNQSSLWGYGGVYSGAPYLGVEGGEGSFGRMIPNKIGEYTHGEIANPYAPRQLVSEQIYRGFIEPVGLTGFATSALAWGGQEPYIDQPVFAQASEMDSQARAYWDSNLGDMFLLNEGLRRLYPHPRNDYEKVNPLRNKMPGWMPDKFKYGDPYCLTPETLVETSAGLKRADDVKSGDLIRTVKGRYYPVNRIAVRVVDEDVYTVKLKNLPWEIRVTSEHPFYVDRDWVKAEDLLKSHVLTYPLLKLDVPGEIQFYEGSSRAIVPTKLPLTGKLARLTALLFKAVKTINNQNFTLAGDYADETRALLSELFNVKPQSHIYKVYPLVDYIHYLNDKGLPAGFYGVGLPVFLQFMAPFGRTDHMGYVRFKLPNEQTLYQAWSILVQHGHVGRVENGELYFTHGSARQIGQLCGFVINGWPLDTDLGWAAFEGYADGGRYEFLRLKIESIRKEHYNGFVYGYEVDADDSFCVAGCLTHNTKLPFGELLLPGSGYEAVTTPELTFPSGPSSLGKDAYTQAMQMIGLRDPMSDRTEEILEEGTRTHRMIQDMLTRQSIDVKSESMIFDAENNIKGYVDVMARDSLTNNGWRPVEIKTIGGDRFGDLRFPKFEHQVQLNTYMNIMDEQKGTLLYVNRDDPSQIKTFNLKYDPRMQSETVSRLRQARSMAKEFIDQGYGDKTGGYSFLDRAAVLINADPFAKETREVFRILDSQREMNLLSTEQEERLTTLERQKKSMMWRQEMYPNRFDFSKIMTPDVAYENYSLNENIKAAAEYNLPERVVGSVWEKFTHLRSPLHSKFFGMYSPTEQYERNVLYGRDFKSWSHPYSHWIEPYSRGLKSVTNPVQGAISWGTGGFIAGGPLLASITAPAGAVYGSLHGLYRMATGTKYVPDRFQGMSEVSEYFDRAKYQQAHMMYLATNDRSFMKQMEQTTTGWVISGMADEGLRQYTRHRTTPAEQALGDDMGFGSKYKGLKGVKDTAGLFDDIFKEVGAALTQENQINKVVRDPERFRPLLEYINRNRHTATSRNFDGFGQGVPYGNWLHGRVKDRVMRIWTKHTGPWLRGTPETSRATDVAYLHTLLNHGGKGARRALDDSIRKADAVNVSQAMHYTRPLSKKRGKAIQAILDKHVSLPDVRASLMNRLSKGNESVDQIFLRLLHETFYRSQFSKPGMTFSKARNLTFDTRHDMVANMLRQDIADKLRNPIAELLPKRVRIMPQKGRRPKNDQLTGLADEGLRQNVRKTQNPDHLGTGPDTGFGSPWKGTKLFMAVQKMAKKGKQIVNQPRMADEIYDVVNLADEVKSINKAISAGLKGTFGTPQLTINPVSKSVAQELSLKVRTDLIHTSNVNLNKAILPGVNDVHRVSGVYALRPDYKGERYGKLSYKVSGLFLENAGGGGNFSTLGQPMKRHGEHFVASGGIFLRGGLFKRTKTTKKVFQYADDELHQMDSFLESVGSTDAVSIRKRVENVDKRTDEIRELLVSKGVFKATPGVDSSPDMITPAFSFGTLTKVKRDGVRYLKHEESGFMFPHEDKSGDIGKSLYQILNPKSPTVFDGPPILSARGVSAYSVMEDFRTATGNEIFLKGGTARNKYLNRDVSGDLDFLVIPKKDKNIEDAAVSTAKYFYKHGIAEDVGIEHSVDAFFHSTDLTINQVLLSSKGKVTMSKQAYHDYQSKVLRTTEFQQSSIDYDKQLYRIRKFKAKKEFEGWTDETAARRISLDERAEYLSKNIVSSEEYAALHGVTADARLKSKSALQVSREMNTPLAKLGSPNRGHQSPWGGMDTGLALMQNAGQEHTLESMSDPRYEAKLNTAVKGLPAWDKPYFYPFLNTTDAGEREHILKMVDGQMKSVLQVAWGGESDIPDMARYWDMHQQPDADGQLMDPRIPMEDVMLKTVEASGFDKHDFGLGWSQQEMRMRNSPHQVGPIDINAAPMPSAAVAVSDPSVIRQQIEEILAGFGLVGHNIKIRQIPGDDSTVKLNINVSRDRSNIDFINGLNIDLE
ncbi:Hint domain-containing protein [Acinetobacter sp.]|uniref:Hint domain-containing protein n=1 Tax=Acinetobacter sp. TaxID=472 RepID=UPI003D07A199